MGSLDTPSFAYDIEVVGELPYVADGVAGLRIIDVSNPAEPVEFRARGTDFAGAPPPRGAAGTWGWTSAAHP